MPRKQLMVFLIVLTASSLMGCGPFASTISTPIPAVTTAELPTLAPATQTAVPSPTARTYTTPDLPAIVVRSPTSPPKLATATGTPQTAASVIPPPTLVVESLLVGPGKPGRLYAYLRDGYSLMLDHKFARIVVSEDQGANWSAFPGGLPVAPECMYNLNMDYATVDELYASTCQGIYHWTGVNKWRRISDLKTRMVAVTYHQPMNLWAAVISTTSAPVAKSTDGGATWKDASTGLVHFNGVENVAIDPRSPTTLYAIIMPKYAGSYLRRKMGDNQWQEMTTPLDNSQIEVGMTIDGATGSLYITARDAVTNLGQGNWQVWRSPNPNAPMDAVKWERVYDFGDAAWASMLASGWSPQGLALYARVTLADYQQILMRSLDSGKTWTTVKTP